MAVQLNTFNGSDTQLLKALLWTMVKVANDQKTGIVQALQYANNQQAELETDANQ